MSYEDAFLELEERFGIVADEGQLSDLKTVNNELLFLKREIDARLETNYENASNINNDIIDISDEASFFRTKVNGLKNKDAGSIQMYKDIRERYNQHLVGNILLFSLVSFGGYIVFSKRNQ